MSYLYFKHVFDHGAIGDGNAGPWIAREPSSHAQMSDRAMDTALRNVPLPRGLMTRLGMLVYTVSDDAADQADWLGC